MATLKQKQAIQNIVENHGNISRAMLDAGYDPTTAKNPKNLTENKGFQKLKEEYKREFKAIGINGKKLAEKVGEFNFAYCHKGKIYPTIIIERIDRPNSP